MATPHLLNLLIAVERPIVSFHHLCMAWMLLCDLPLPLSPTPFLSRPPPLFFLIASLAVAYKNVLS